MHIIGLVGPIACGKGVVADYLIQKYGYSSFSLSSLLHDELKRRGITYFTRATLQDLGDELRRKEGEGVLAKRAIQQLKAESQKLKACSLQLETYNLQNKNQANRKKTEEKLQVTSFKFQKILIEGIRNPGEVAFLRTIPGFILIAVDASAKTRFQRILQRGKPWDPKDWKSFLKVDGRDREDIGNASGQQVRRCMELADARIENEGEKGEVEEAVKSLSF